MKNNKSYKQLNKELEDIMYQLDKEFDDIDKSIELYKQAEKIIDQIDVYLKNAKTKIVKIKKQSSK